MQGRGEENSQDYCGESSFDVGWVPGTQGERKQVRKLQESLLQENVIDRLPELPEYIERKIKKLAMNLLNRVTQEIKKNGKKITIKYRENKKFCGEGI